MNFEVSQIVMADNIPWEVTRVVTANNKEGRVTYLDVVSSLCEEMWKCEHDINDKVVVVLNGKYFASYRYLN